MATAVEFSYWILAVFRDVRSFQLTTRATPLAK